MCGILGGFFTNTLNNKRLFLPITEQLVILSEERGRDSAGLYVCSKESELLSKKPIRARNFFKSEKDNLKKFVDSNDSWIAQLGHCRLATNGDKCNQDNNQPVKAHSWVGVHNGIIVNYKEMWEKIDEKPQSEELDSEVLLAFMNQKEKEGATTEESVKMMFGEIEGEASIGLISPNKKEIVLASNCGSLYCWSDNNEKIIFSSEEYILKQTLTAVNIPFSEDEIINLKNMFWIINFDNFDMRTGCLPTQSGTYSDLPTYNRMDRLGEKKSEFNKIYELKRCTKCILPETFPGISFDEDGVCNICNSHVKKNKIGIEVLREKLAKKGLTPGTKCIVPFSGGRDSCYGLHIIKKELGLDPIAYTYDWGMVTDIARRNCARFCGKLGVEHVIVSADIDSKMSNINKNVNAWMKTPHLGMVPLFMAGDKQFYYYANRLRKQTGINDIIFCSGNDYETTLFKTGFCGLKEGSKNGVLSNVSKSEKARLIMFYLNQFARNPRYLNLSLIDTVTAFFSSYGIEHDYIHLFHYLNWDEDEIMTLLVNEYNWEVDAETTVTWRIGDGSASFYNYIYYVVAGFTENDTFRSNQIRDGVLSREDAIKLVHSENLPRWDALEDYCKRIGVSFNDIVGVINEIPKLY